MQYFERWTLRIFSINFAWFANLRPNLEIYTALRLDSTGPSSEAIDWPRLKFQRFRSKDNQLLHTQVFLHWDLEI